MVGTSADRELVRAARQGDRGAFAGLIERHYPLLLSSCARMLGDRELARDAAQEAVIRGLLGLDRLRDDRRFGPWLVGIGLNVCRGMLAAAQSVAPAEPAEFEQRTVTADIDPAHLMLRSEFSQQLRAAIRALPAGQRQAVALFYLAGLTHAETARELGTRPGAIKRRLHKARAALRASLNDIYPEQEETQMTNPSGMIRVHVAGLRRTAATNTAAERHVMFLEDGSGDRRLPIWIGMPEASSIAVVLEQVQLPRPGVYQFTAALLVGAGATLREVQITELTASTFYAVAVLADGTSIDARPSDAITLALICDAPIYVQQQVLDAADGNRDQIADLIDEAEAATDDEHVVAQDFMTAWQTASGALQRRKEA